MCVVGCLCLPLIVYVVCLWYDVSCVLCGV